MYLGLQFHSIFGLFLFSSSFKSAFGSISWCHPSYTSSCKMSQTESSKMAQVWRGYFLWKRRLPAVTTGWETNSAHLSSTIVAAADNSLILCGFLHFDMYHYCAQYLTRCMKCPGKFQYTNQWMFAHLQYIFILIYFSLVQRQISRRFLWGTRYLLQSYASACRQVQPFCAFASNNSSNNCFFTEFGKSSISEISEHHNAIIQLQSQNHDTKYCIT